MSDQVDHADNVERADIVLKADVVQATTDNPPPVDHRKSNILWLLVLLTFGISSLAFAGLSIYFLRDSARVKAQATAQIAVLNTKVVALQKQIEDQANTTRKVLDEQQAKSACYQLYTGQITLANASSVAAQNDLFIMAFSQTSPDPAVRHTELLPFIEALRTTSAAVRSASAARDVYVAAGQPLPCILDVS